MKRMISELILIYWKSVRLKELAKKLLTIYSIFGFMSLLLYWKGHSVFKPTDPLLLCAIVTILLIIMIPFHWKYEVKPYTDEAYKEIRIEREYPFFLKRFNDRN